MENLERRWFTSELLQNAEIRKCPHCRRWFKAGLCSCGFRQAEIHAGKRGRTGKLARVAIAAPLP